MADARSAATKRRDTPVVLVAKSEQDARELLEELADDPRVAMSHVELGNGKYVLGVRYGGE